MKTTCNGTGYIICRCGGDLCVCGIGEEECPGCSECEDMDEIEAEHRERDDEIADKEFELRARRDAGEFWHW